MAMNAEALGLAIANAVTDAGASAEAKVQVQQMWTKIAGEIITHIQTSAQVMPGIAVSTTGSAVAQTGATTGTGRIT